MRYWLVMPAAGAGRRFGSAKQYAPLAGRTVLELALQPFLADQRCAGGCVVLAGDDAQRTQLARQLPAQFLIATGGRERAHSVHNGLLALAAHLQPEDWVLVHDAARPCLSAADLARLLEQGASDSVGAQLAVPLADTLKRAEGSGPAMARIAQTVPREGLWLAQTPQMFRYAALRGALERAMAAERMPTDEAQAMEWCGLCARLVAAQDSNPKVTGAADLALAEAILATRSKQPCA